MGLYFQYACKTCHIFILIWSYWGAFSLLVILNCFFMLFGLLQIFLWKSLHPLGVLIFFLVMCKGCEEYWLFICDRWFLCEGWVWVWGWQCLGSHWQSRSGCRQRQWWKNAEFRVVVEKQDSATGIGWMQEGKEAVKILRVQVERVDRWQCLLLDTRTVVRDMGS